MRRTHHGDLHPVLERSILAAPRRKDADRKGGWTRSTRRADRKASAVLVVKYVNGQALMDCVTVGRPVREKREFVPKWKA